MEIEFKGGNCVVISAKKSILVVDGKLSDLGLNDQAGKATVQVATQKQFVAEGGDDIITFDGPGEYEAGAFSIRGISAQSHLDPKDAPHKATMYRIVADDIAVGVVGHVYPDLTEEQLESLGVIDVLVVPVGNSGYTLDAHGAVSVVRKVDPKIVIPTHYADSSVNYPVPQAELEPFLKELGATGHETDVKLKLKGGVMSDVLVVHELTRVK